MADEGYCMKCREKREFEGQVVTLKNGRPAAQGTCPVCGTKLTKILGMDAAKARGWTRLIPTGRGPVSSGGTAAARERSASAPT